MFDQWESDPEYPTLFRVDRDVTVSTAEALPSTSSVRSSAQHALCCACGTHTPFSGRLSAAIAKPVKQTGVC